MTSLKLPKAMEWRAVAAVLALLALTLAVSLIYTMKPQSPVDFTDRLVLQFNIDAYGPNLRAGQRLQRRADRAASMGADSLAESLEWRAAHAFARSGAGAPGPNEARIANDRAADVYLTLGREYLSQGRGVVLGYGRRVDRLLIAERAAVCAAALNPTERRGEINAFVAEVEDALERPPAGRCPQ